ncbi:hypothetical protein FWF48_00535 [Candidatus Saccharibacteria bacterium]|nr:hypothetical protein [Candidatus Saccharibacteria bacterium]
MIEINLIPDVKRELLKAQKIRNLIISISILASLVAAGVVVLLAVTVYVGQVLASQMADNSINDEFNKFKSHQNVSQVLTIQDQLNNLAQLDSQRYTVSRIFGILDVISPSNPNQITVSELRYDKATRTVSIEGQAANGFVALEAFQKTITSTTYEYAHGKGNLITSPVVVGEQSMGQDSGGNLVLRFSLSFTIDENVLLSSSKSMKIIGPNEQNATDSHLQIPDDIFGAKATDLPKENQ